MNSCNVETANGLCIECNLLGDTCDGTKEHMEVEEIIDAVIKRCRIVSRPTGKAEIIVDDDVKLHEEIHTIMECDCNWCKK